MHTHNKLFAMVAVLFSILFVGPLAAEEKPTPFFGKGKEVVLKGDGVPEFEPPLKESDPLPEGFKWAREVKAEITTREDGTSIIAGTYVYAPVGGPGAYIHHHNGNVLGLVRPDGSVKIAYIVTWHPDLTPAFTEYAQFIEEGKIVKWRGQYVLVTQNNEKLSKKFSKFYTTPYDGKIGNDERDQIVRKFLFDLLK